MLFGRRVTFTILVLISELLLIGAAIAWCLHMFLIAKHGQVYFVEENSAILYGEIVATTIIAILSGPGIAFLFGTRYELAPGFLSLALLQFLAVGLGSLSVYAFLNSQGDTVTSFRLNAITLGLNMALGTVFTWRWGVPGLLVALFGSSIAGNLLNQYVINKK